MRSLSRRAKIIAAAVVGVVAIVVAVVLVLVLTSGGSKAPPSHAAFAQLYNSAVVGQTKLDDALAKWPSPPYQDFHDGNGNHCLEWFDKPTTLYDLCFGKNDVLISKQTP